MKNMGWIGGWYRVRSTTKNGKLFDQIFPTEQEARASGNEQWKLPFVVKVEIIKMAFDYKKHRKAVHIAEATKRSA